jgi:FKBP-type peptidyl-prolyl cis-trans isomerase
MNKKLLTVLGCVTAFVLLGGVLWVDRGSHNETLPIKDKQITMETRTDGLKIEILTEGSGASVASGQTAVVNYTGTLTDGTVFDSSIPRGQTFPVHLGRGEVIKGWDIGLIGMKVGEKRKLTIPPELAYGKEGFPGVIPESATLIFEITLESIQ